MRFGTQATSTVLLSMILLSSIIHADETKLVDPNSIQLGPIIHDSLPDELLERIRRISSIFEVVDGVGYEQAVDLYKRDPNPETNIRIFEEMARVYQSFCEGRCSTHSERMDVYRLVLLSSMFPKHEVLDRVELQMISEEEAGSIISQYSLEPEPIPVIQR